MTNIIKNRNAPSFLTHFDLPDTVDREKINARYENGILSLTLPKKEVIRPGTRQININ
jgi:HSP20 family protein